MDSSLGNKNFEKNISLMFDKSSKSIIDSKTLTKKISIAINHILFSLENNHKIILFGNGGSAADAQHMAAEFIGRYKIERESIPAISLTTDTSILTSIGNDYSYDQVFSRQCQSLVHDGDVVIAISTSGNSKNVIKGCKIAKKNGAFIISLTGKTGGSLKSLSDVLLNVPSTDTPRIQESHRTIIHSICELVELNFKK